MNVTVEVSNDCPECWAPADDTMGQWLAEASRALANRDVDCNVSVRVVDERDGAVLNQQYRGKTTATNVLSFPCALPETVRAVLASNPLGDIALCAPVIALEAQEQGKSLEAHWAHMLTHGYLHLHGFDHQNEQEAKQMESLEIQILSRLGYPSPY